MSILPTTSLKTGKEAGEIERHRADSIWHSIRSLPIYRNENTNSLLAAIGLSRTTLIRTPRLSVRTRMALVDFLEKRLEEQAEVMASIQSLISEIRKV